MKNIFRIIAFLEGVSYILLLFIAVPIKYSLGDSTYVKLLGMPHGVLFVAYLLFAIIIKNNEKWNKTELFIILICSIVPFGTFYIDKKYLKI
jgi:integral membrane protein|tara:strand:+ start:78 stop:353 length:276 start_codon:yes stop_codon:yes gene_type:complete